MQYQLDHEKLDVYQIELQFVAWATDLMAELSGSPETRTRRIAETFDHLDRASLSSLFNTAEGNGKRQMSRLLHRWQRRNPDTGSRTRTRTRTRETIRP